MNERNPILDEIAASGLFEVMPPQTIQTQRVLAAMACFADPSTRELKTPVYKIAVKASSAAPGTMIFPEQAAGMIRQLSEFGIVEKVSEGEPPTWRIPCRQRLVEAGSRITAKIATEEQPFPYVAPDPTGFEERRRGRR